MQQEFSLSLPPEFANEIYIRENLIQLTELEFTTINHIEILKKSIDARARNILINLKILVVYNDPEYDKKKLPNQELPDFQMLRPNHKVLIIGAGPAGLFAAIKLLEKGIKPVIIERGKDVKERRRDLALINRNHIVNQDSNYCFGEGGAGTYSDGKLYTRSKKRGDINSVLKIFVGHGADKNILFEAHPHIGTNKLPGIISNIRSTILKHGGEIHFNTRVIDLIINNSEIKGVNAINVLTGMAQEHTGNAVILCTGHSGREIYEILDRKKVLIEFKPFAMGVRVEHPQELIDGIQYHCRNSEEIKNKRTFLPAASYSLVSQFGRKGIYSFCMCPGGIIAPCATREGEIVTNGWSPSKRNNPFANSGIVVNIEKEDIESFKASGPLAGLAFQKHFEQKACRMAGGNQTAPGQRLMDFIENRISSGLPETSYKPGVTSMSMYEIFPPLITNALREGFKDFGKKMRGYLTNEALMVAVESRTSSPVRIPRDHTFQHVEIRNLFPCGEGAGYAGGIVSAAIDGQKCAEAISGLIFSS